MQRNAQLRLLKNQTSAYGGELRKTRKGRTGGRPIDTKNSMHCVLRSSKAKGKWSFRYGSNPQKVWTIVQKFAAKYGVKILSFVNVGNHLHLQLKASNRRAFKSFMRAITGAIAMAVTGVSRWSKYSFTKEDGTKAQKLKFWDYRPFSRVIVGWKALLTLKDYFEINKWEGWGAKREEARTMMEACKAGSKYWGTA